MNPRVFHPERIPSSRKQWSCLVERAAQVRVKENSYLQLSGYVSTSYQLKGKRVTLDACQSASVSLSRGAPVATLGPRALSGSVPVDSGPPVRRFRRDSPHSPVIGAEIPAL